MKAKTVKAYACGFCSKTYPHNQVGKVFAEECCLCTECKTGRSLYTGRGAMCRECARVKDLASAEESMVALKKRIERLRISQ